MAAVYALVKKNSTAHQSAKASLRVKNDTIVSVTDSHVLIPAAKSIDYGHDVSHAKNRVTRRRMPNLHVMHVEMAGQRTTIRLSNRDRRSMQKLAKQAE